MKNMSTETRDQNTTDLDIMPPLRSRETAFPGTGEVLPLTIKIMDGILVKYR